MRKNLGLLVISLFVTASLFGQEMPFLVNQPIHPSWVPLWDWERASPMTERHSWIAALTGTENVGACCAEGVTHDGLSLHLCFAPGTPPEYVEYVSRLIFGDFLPAYNAAARWTFTSYGSTDSWGTPIQLRWSFVPDGTLLPGHQSSDMLPSNLFNAMDRQFNGNTALWQAKFHYSFERWSQVAGLRFTQVSDDGAPFPNSPGSATGARGDIRIGARSVDGAGGLLAFN